MRGASVVPPSVVLVTRGTIRASLGSADQATVSGSIVRKAVPTACRPEATPGTNTGTVEEGGRSIVPVTDWMST